MTRPGPRSRSSPPARSSRSAGTPRSRARTSRTSFSTEIVERNLIYLDPILFSGLALVIARRGTRWWWALASGAFGIYLVQHLPYGIGGQVPVLRGSRARDHRLRQPRARVAAGNDPRRRHRRRGRSHRNRAGLRYLPARGRLAGAVIAAICGAMLVWNVTTETYAAQGEYHLSHNLARNFTHPFDWVDQATGGRPPCSSASSSATRTGSG